ACSQWLIRGIRFHFEPGRLADDPRCALNRVVVVGAGIGGLSAAALLARAGIDTTVLEANTYPGGCAGTFPRSGYRFDAGATLPVGFYPGGPMDILSRVLRIDWPAHPDPRVMTVHLPDGSAVTRRSDDSRWDERRSAFGAPGERFWRWQEQAADELWDFALRLPPWPPQSARQVMAFGAAGADWLRGDLRSRLSPGLAADAFRPVAAHLGGASERLRLFVDSQLMISAQTTSAQAVALYGAAALDLPRRGPAHLPGGMGAAAGLLADAVARFGGRVLYRQEAARVVMEGGRAVAVETRNGDSFAADGVVLNVTPGNAAALVDGKDPSYPPDGWGAFMLYAGLDGSAVPAEAVLHHQVVTREPLSEGNAPFISISPAWDETRAPIGLRAVTISAHTRIADWWALRRSDRAAYDARKSEYAARVLAACETAIPGIRDAAEFVLTATPVTFRRYTRRAGGWVGGFPQSSLFRFHGPRYRRGIWIAGDSIFPGQSVAAAALGGIRVARQVLALPDSSGKIRDL
ncbi:MAG: FAD-dependent oxidoreductase, partial [Anaerolineae bacterium]|nr:FAD-dependent oxidoreductase [Anaerolineae bacterium]